MQINFHMEHKMSAPRVFISYSHDDLDHKKWVLNLATRLRNAGVDAIIDQWELGPGDDLPHFMETQLAMADRVIMVCTDKYVSKANKGAGGVGYEKMIVTASMMQTIDSNKVIPVIRQAASNDVPTFLKTKLYIDFSKDDEFEAAIDDLVRAIHGEPLFKKPELGNNPYKAAEETPAQRNNDTKIDILRLLTAFYEAGHDQIEHKEIYSTLSISRLLFDVHVKELVSEGLLKNVLNRYVSLTDKGKLFAIKSGFVE